MQDLVSGQVWLSGPRFLSMEEGQWPDQGFFSVDESDPEIRQEVVSLATAVSAPSQLLIEKYSSWYRLLQAVSWIVRIQRAVKGGRWSKESLSAADSKLAEESIIK